MIVKQEATRKSSRRLETKADPACESLALYKKGARKGQEGGGQERAKSQRM